MLHKGEKCNLSLEDDEAVTGSRMTEQSRGTDRELVICGANTLDDKTEMGDEEQREGTGRVVSSWGK